MGSVLAGKASPGVTSIGASAFPYYIKKIKWWQIWLVKHDSLGGGVNSDLVWLGCEASWTLKPGGGIKMTGLKSLHIILFQTNKWYTDLIWLGYAADRALKLVSHPLLRVINTKKVPTFWVFPWNTYPFFKIFWSSVCLIGGGTGVARGASGPSNFQMGGMAPPLFWPSCSKVNMVKDTPAVDLLSNV